MVNKATVHGEVIPPSESAQELQATRLAEAEALAVQRKQKINLIWERTQAVLAIASIMGALLISGYIAITNEPDNRVASFLFLTNIANLVAGFYFGRTNHARPTGENKD